MSCILEMFATAAALTSAFQAFLPLGLLLSPVSRSLLFFFPVFLALLSSPLRLFPLRNSSYHASRPSVLYHTMPLARYGA